MVPPARGGIHRGLDAEICLRYKRRAIISAPRAVGEHRPRGARCLREEEVEGTDMLAIIGNIITGLGVVSLFTATLRLTKPGKRA